MAVAPDLGLSLSNVLAHNISFSFRIIELFILNLF